MNARPSASRDAKIILPSRRQALHWLLAILLVLLFLSTLVWLPWHAQRMEADERQEQLIADTLWVEQTIRFQISRNEESLRLIGADLINGSLSGSRLRDRLRTFIRNNRELAQIAWYDEQGRLLVAANDEDAVPFRDLSAPSRAAAEHARATRTPQYSQPAPRPGFAQPMLMDYHVPLYSEQRYAGSLVATYSMPSILDEMVPWWFAQDNEISLTDNDDVVVARRLAGGQGRGVYTHQRALDLHGATITLRTNSIKSAPRLLPNLLVGSVIVLSLGLLWSLWALWRDINRRMVVENALRQQVAFRAAMENSLVTGMRARDLDGRITYVNPAFCEMVGLPAERILGHLPPMPYWAPDTREEFHQHLSDGNPVAAPPQGVEMIFRRANGERFPVLIFESPLVDDAGRQTGWMGSILDISDRKRIEDLNRQQQEKLQVSARLATMGEIASTLAHELNQPLAAISSYTTGALNLLNNAAARPDSLNPELLKGALEKAGAQAQRAGHIIRSVHAFVKRREPAREKVVLQSLIDGILPLVQLQAQQFFVHVQANVAAGLPIVLADRVLLEQVLLNLTRNAIEAMQHVTPDRRILRIVAECEGEDQAHPAIAVSVIDHGHGIPPEVAERLFSPFFSTKAEGMGIGLSICRTAVEFHGGTLSHADNPAGGTIFRMTLPAVAEADLPVEE